MDWLVRGVDWLRAFGAFLAQVRMLFRREGAYPDVTTLDATGLGRAVIGKLASFSSAGKLEALYAWLAAWPRQLDQLVVWLKAVVAYWL